MRFAKLKYFKEFRRWPKMKCNIRIYKMKTQNFGKVYKLKFKIPVMNIIYTI